ncbi:MAG: cyclase family protein [Nitrososphaerota archaeon]|nr:cyclase family protein [Nitrososphaerota archaeon]MDG7024111.1 cyclase family protein [Nitrososphaerota archaeon]
MKLPAVAGHAVDLSQTIENGMTVYVGDAVPKISALRRLEKDGVNLSIMTLGSHTGTHVDAPVHFIKGGKALDQISVENFIGEAVVLDFSGIRPGCEISASALQKHSGEVGRGDIVLLYTGLSRRWEDPRARRTITYLGGEAARWLVRRGVKAVGIDYLSVEKFGAKVPVAHVTLLSHEIPIIESLNKNLSRLVGRRVLFFCLPIKVGGCDGAPARAIAYPLRGDGGKR